MTCSDVSLCHQQSAPVDVVAEDSVLDLTSVFVQGIHHCLTEDALQVRETQRKCALF